MNKPEPTQPTTQIVNNSAPTGPQEPILSKKRMLEYAMDAAKTAVTKRYPKADFRHRGWGMLFQTIARTAEQQFDDRTEQGKVPLRINNLGVRLAFQKLANSMIDDAETDHDFMLLCGITMPPKVEVIPPEPTGSQP